MSWFDVDESGVSFQGDLIWGDEPADAVDDFLLSVPQDLSIQDAWKLLEDSFTGSPAANADVNLVLLAEGCLQNVQSSFEEIYEVIDLDTLRAGFLFSTGHVLEDVPVAKICEREWLQIAANKRELQ